MSVQEFGFGRWLTAHSAPNGVVTLPDRLDWRRGLAAMKNLESCSLFLLDEVLARAHNFFGSLKIT